MLKRPADHSENFSSCTPIEEELLDAGKALLGIARAAA